MAISKVVTPGPGSYNPLKPFGYRAFTTNMDAFCTRNKHMNQVNVRAMNGNSPGPACYLPHYGASSEKTHGVSVIFASHVKNCHNLNTGDASPGPGTYKTNVNCYKPTQGGVRFGKSERVTGIPSAIARMGGPGPGDYNPLCGKPLGMSGINGFTKSSPMVGGRPASHPNKKVPAPNAYNPKNNLNDVLSKKGGSVSFGVAERFTPIRR